MNAYTIHGLQASPVVMKCLMSSISASKLDQPSHPDRFSPRFIVAHMADWEPILLQRIRSAVENPGCEIIGIDEVVRAAEQNYAAKDWRVELDRWRAARQQSVEFIQSLSNEDLGKMSVHNEKGPMSVGDQIEMFLGHDLYHLRQLAEVVDSEVVGTW